MAKLREPDQLPVKAQQQKDRIAKDSARRPRKQCTNCGSEHFHRHQRRSRWFLVVLDKMVWPILCILWRWRCTVCGMTFTHLPAGCLPFKRYLREEIEERCERYVEDERISYRKVVRDEGAAVVYDDPVADGCSSEAQREDESVRELAPSTPHRWISTIGGCTERWQPLISRARQSEMGARLSSIVIAPWKYRSLARKKLLHACCLLLRAVRIAGIRNPTRLATLGSSP
jgi:hypothetical protein